MFFKFTNPLEMNCVITGASKGLGWAIAEKMAENRFSLILCSRNKEEISAAVALLKNKYEIDAYSFSADLSKKDDVLAFGDFCNKTFNHIDVLVNNAGVFLGGFLMDEDDGRLEKMIETNVYSAYHLSRALLPTMVKRGRGHIFNMCSIASIVAYPGGGSYSISKFALYGMTKVMREELKDKGIKVTAILPGAAWSNSWAGVDLPHDRLMEANDIALLVLNALSLSDSAVVEEIIVRPQLGDL